MRRTSSKSDESKMQDHERKEDSMFQRTVPDSTLALLSYTQARFIVSMQNIPSNVKGEALKEMVAQMFPSASLVDKKICALPRVRIELRNFLNVEGAVLQQHFSRRVILTLAHGLILTLKTDRPQYKRLAS